MRVAAWLTVAAVVVSLAGCGGSDPIDSTEGLEVARYEVASAFTGRTLPQTALVPPGTGRPLLVFLHGKTGNGHKSNATDTFRAALEALGDAAPVVVFPNGGDGSYWHARDSGDWASYVLREVVPEATRRFDTDPRRIAIGGISMGGFGAYDVARAAPGRFCAVGGHSAALWLTSGETAPGAFDDAEDFTRHDLIAIARAEGRRPWEGAALWLDTGTEDPFRTADQAFADALGIRLRVWDGEHGGSYWPDHYDEYLRFYARALERC